MIRYSGICDLLCPIDVAAAAEWVSAIPLGEWPQQDRARPESPYPAMVAAHRDWHGIAAAVEPLVAAAMAAVDGGRPEHQMLSLLVPGQRVNPHTDVQSEAWRLRVHIPILTNPDVTFLAGGTEVRMPAGAAYLFNPEVEHTAANRGPTDRVHFFFDVFERTA